MSTKYPFLEKVLSSQNSFTTSVDVDIDLFHKGERISEVNWPSKVILEWYYSVETRSWGIKSIDPYLNNYKLGLEGSIPQDDESDTDFSVTIDLSNAESSEEFFEEASRSLSPDSISLKIEGDPNSPESWKCTRYKIVWRT